jgi:hypothetical protein
MDGKIIKYNTLDIYKIYSKEISDSEIEKIVEDNHLKPEPTSINATRPIDSMQPLVQNPAGLNPAYHPQPGREVFFQLTYRY